MSSLRFQPSPEEYEDGVFELMQEKFDGHGTVERNVRLPSRSGGRDRQIDVLVRVPAPGMDDMLIVVECKRYGRKVHKKDVEAFIGLVEDVGAARGVLVTTEGFSSGAELRADFGREIHVDVVPVEALPDWGPPLVVCELCAEAVGEDALPGMAYIDLEAELETNGDDPVPTTLGYCEKCSALHIECPVCATINVVHEMRTDEWIECEGGCGLEWNLSRMMTKDDLSGRTHDRITLRIPA